MAQVNLTIDDFDPLFLTGFSNLDDWQTPNPQDHPDWYNATGDVTGVPWYEATYHQTTISGAKAALNFTGSAITIYGAGGPSDTNYTITIDPSSSSPFTQSYATSNSSGRTVLYTAEDLTYSPHVVEIVNYGSGLLLDMAVVGVELGADGATLANTTVENDDSRIQYSGSWTTQSGSSFHGGTSTYTQGPGNSWSVSFEGSAIYVYGDQVNDHGFYSVSLNGSTTPYATYDGRSGCGSGYAKYCEKLHGLLAFAGNLPQGTHNFTLVNGGPADGNQTFVDFDYLEYTTPSAYSTQALTASNCPFTTCNSTSGGGSSSVGPSGTASGSSSGTASASAAASSTGAADVRVGGMGTGMLGLVLGAWLLRRWM